NIRVQIPSPALARLSNTVYFTYYFVNISHGDPHTCVIPAKAGIQISFTNKERWSGFPLSRE
ncbi:MAG: hypothetical protein AAB968_01985, partial [Patescibacteria group bacterium]